MTSTATDVRPSSQSSTRGRRIYSVLIGLTSFGVLLQAVWAGIFLEHDGNRPDKWINVHARGAEVCIGLAIVALIAAAIWQRHRTDLLIGTGLLMVGLILEAYLGGRITDDGDDTLTAIHVPLAMAIMGLAVWLPLRTRSRAAIVDV